MSLASINQLKVSPIKNITRRDFLKMSGIAAGGALFAACSPQSRELYKPNQKYDNIFIEKLRSFGMEEFDEYTLRESGIIYKIYTDDPAKVRLNKFALDMMVVNQIPQVFDNLTHPDIDDAFKLGLKHIHSFFMEGNYPSFNIHVGVPSDLATCLIGTNEDLKEMGYPAPIPADQDPGTFCSTNAGHQSYVFKEKIIIPQSALIIATGASRGGQGTIYPFGEEFTLTPSQLVGSGTFHEQLHLILNPFLEGRISIDEEEGIVQLSEKTRLDMIAAGTLQDTLPFEFI